MAGKILFTTAGPRTNRKKNPAAWRKVGANGWRKGDLGVTFSHFSGGYFGSTPREDGPVYPTLAQAKAWAESHAAVTQTRYNGKAPAKRRKNTRKPADPVAARELELYIENEFALVGAANSQGRMIMRNLAQKMLRGTYDSTKAWKIWMYLADEGARRYNREFGTRVGMGSFDKPTREMVAHALSEAFESEVKSGALDIRKLAQ